MTREAMVNGGQVGWIVTVTWDAWCWDCAPDAETVRSRTGLHDPIVLIEPLGRGLAASERMVCVGCGKYLGAAPPEYG